MTTMFGINSSISSMQATNSQLADYQNQISTQKKIQQPSDDPVASQQIDTLRRNLSGNTAYQKNIKTATAVSDQSNAALSDISTQLSSIQNKLQQAMNGTNSSSTRDILAKEISSATDQIDSYKTTTDTNGNALFPANSSQLITYPIGDSRSVAATLTQSQVFNFTASSGSGAGSTVDLSTLLQNTQTAIKNNDSSAMGDALNQIQDAISHMSDAQGQQSVLATEISDQDNRLSDQAVTLKSTKSSYEEIDYAEVYSKFTASETQQNAEWAALARVTSSSLFDKLG
ncbi:flagellar hook-associated protein 3 FlgL [Zymomonas mobilis]|uniref:flagellin N-terminal helical domain-containing protein n=1 Tax=Zymomonas mobilis TaxID=542 RepID=UPI00026D842F|nr:flagellin [Zymomonas mobilis]AFN56563.1 flagellin domain protein [Zymomonas mobilis subsp. mobilis ATCC 29191]TQK78007.1 flagellar hook-associated protein 3 FlgL [Zymomonas mobilis]TQL15349.1 flagellar hook-associated protein 3 FlgL [Zymomonas mobilis]GEB86745.1 flagellar hook-filament junction protein FlgL [Zymomonas mobilis subsp. mobilis]